MTLGITFESVLEEFDVEGVLCVDFHASCDFTEERSGCKSWFYDNSVGIAGGGNEDGLGGLGAAAGRAYKRIADGVR